MADYNFNDYPIESINEERLPVVLALDISGSMGYAERLEHLIKAVNRYLEEVRSDSTVAVLTDISIVTFNHEVKVYRDWCPAAAVEPVTFTADGGTDLDGALCKAIEMGRDRAHLTEDIGGHVKIPIVILITDAEGMVSDETHALIKNRADEQKTHIWFFGVPGYNKEMALKVTNGLRCFESSTTVEEGFTQFFEMMAELTKAISKSAPGTKVLLDENPLDREDNVLTVPDLNAWI